jgi:uncharacterized surface protein with fasciclin (FAS1) repeats
MGKDPFGDFKSFKLWEDQHLPQEISMSLFTRILSATAVIAALSMPLTAARAQDIVDVAAGNKDFSTLVAAVKAAGLVTTLKGKGPYTVFAPTNAAFAALPAGTVDTLLLPKNKAKLTKILTYHVVPGNLSAAKITASKKKSYKVKTVNGASVVVDISSGVKVGPAKVTATDVKASNGVIHVIDTVLLPPEKKAKKKAAKH